MQKVKFEAETGAELRKQMLDFLGMGVHSKFVPLTDFGKQIGGEALLAVVDKIEVPAEEPETPVETEPKTRKRRTKAEIAEQAAEETEPPVTEEAPAPEETPVVEETGPKVTKESLTPLVLTLGRAGRKAEVVALLSKYVQADGVSVVTGLPNLQPSDYQAFHDEISAL